MFHLYFGAKAALPVAIETRRPDKEGGGKRKKWKDDGYPEEGFLKYFYPEAEEKKPEAITEEKKPAPRKIKFTKKDDRELIELLQLDSRLRDQQSIESIDKQNAKAKQLHKEIESELAKKTTDQTRKKLLLLLLAA